MRYTLKKGFKSLNGQIEIMDEDRLCYIVKNISKGAYGLRTISKKLLNEFVDYFEHNKTATSVSAREYLTGKSDIDKFEYGYNSTLATMAKMVLGEELSEQDKSLSLLNDSQLMNFNGISGSRKYRPLDTVVKKADKQSLPYLRAMRTKPFLLLAGISGTGKSRIVKEMAFDSCPDNSGLRKDPTSPGNYCLVEVKPNWHDSTELLGYESKINGAEYVVTPFVKFLAKAMLNLDTPFFVCLDEMNLAPVEQYFAEFLSVLESRKQIGNNITSEPLIKASIFKNYESNLKPTLFDIKSEVRGYDNSSTLDDPIHYGKENSVYELLKKQGLRIPPNVVIVGTVNMDETTHQFSRKVIDRAMTIEMNLPKGDPFMDFYNSLELGYRDAPLEASLYLPSKVSAYEALKELAENNAGKTEWLKEEIAKILNGLNAQLEDTPFKIAYRVQNELVLYFFEVWRENKDAKWREILTNAVDQILMMKVLPRIQGDEELLEQPLDKLADFCSSYPNSTKKIQEMKSRLEQAHFTSFWP